MKAVVVTSKGQTELQDFPVPEASSGHVVVKTTAIALNPTDWKHRDFLAPPGSWLGCDFCGTVESIGDGVSHLQKGDRVAAFVHGGQWPGEGSFAEYVKVQASLVWKVPETIGDEEAAAAGGIGPWTAIQALFFRLPIGTPWSPNQEGEPFLVWGGATSVGLYAIQLLKLSGYTVVTTASEKNADLLKSLGATAVYSYSDEDTPAKIAKDYPTLRYALDTIAEGKTTVGAVKSIWDAAGMGKVITLLVNKDDELKQYKDKVPAEMTLVYTVLGVAFDWPGVSFPEMPEDKRQMEEWCAKHIPELVASGKLKPNPIKSFDGGLANITEGLDYIKAGKNRAQKVTYKI
ncbi:zinc-binding alcohol dehydrogenase family protein [Rhodotorula paludigena]|uniref:zinc-binding alcohol dehydrogenase family protein n=1 Tax=Rhodotorula paludigena TaxID=86838 RepID=UPI00317A0512